MLRRMLCLTVLALPWAAPARADVFDTHVLHEIQIVLDPVEWQALKDNYRLNDYYAADVRIDGELFEQAGIRSRGSGSRSPVKPALTVKFNKYRKGATFQGYKAIAVKNLVQDTSMLREALAMPVFEAMGLLAPKVSFTRVFVNGEPYGVYNIIEYVDEVFLKKRLGSASGNLFKYEWNGPYAFEDRGLDPGNYVPDPFKPENDDAEDEDPTNVADFIDTINHADDSTFVQDVSNYIDPRHFLTYVAVENALAESDGILSDLGLNNFYLYQYPGQTRMIFIPWDKNTSFQYPSWPLYRNAELNVLFRRLMQDPGLLKFYVDTVMGATAFFVKPAYLEPLRQAFYQQIRSEALLDDKKPYDNAEFEESVVGLGGVIASRQADVMDQIAGVASKSASSLRRRPTSARP